MQKPGIAGPALNADGAGGATKKVKMSEVKYDNSNMIEANEVTITFNLDFLSHLPYGPDLVLGRMHRLASDLEFIILEKQARRKAMEEPAGPIKIAEH